MRYASWLRNTPAGSQRTRRPLDRGFRPRLEPLEDRRLLATGVFNENFTDDADPNQPGFDSAADGFLFQHVFNPDFFYRFTEFAPQQHGLIVDGAETATVDEITFPLLDPAEHIPLARVDLDGRNPGAVANPGGVQFIGTGRRALTVLASFSSQNGFHQFISASSGELADDGQPLGPIVSVRVVANANRSFAVDNVSVFVDRELANTPPIAADNQVTTPPGTPIGIDVLNNDFDFDADPLTIVSASDPPHGTVEIGGLIAYTPDAGFVGVDSFTYTITDGRGGTATATVHVTVNTPPPAFNYDFDQVHGVLGPLTIAAPGVLERTVDAEGDPLTPEVVSGPGRGQLHGTVRINTDGSFSYTPASADGHVVSDFFQYRISDGFVYSNVATVAIHVPNVPPTAVDDFQPMPHGAAQFTSVSPGVLANDPADPDGDAVTPVVDVQARHGLVVFNADGSFTYTPTDSPVVRPDSFTYRLSDGYADGNPATVRLLVPNRAPAVSGEDYTIAPQMILDRPAGELLANDTDPDFDPLTVEALTKLPGHGAVELREDGSFTYTPDGFFEGTDTFGYRVSDGIDDSREATVTIRRTNGLPRAVNDTYVVDPNADQFAANVLANDVDPFGRPLTVPGVTRLPAHGVVLLHPDGNFSYFPDDGFTGRDSFEYVVESGTLQSAPAYVSLQVTDDVRVPIATDDTYQTLHDFPLEVPASIGFLHDDLIPAGPDTHLLINSLPRFGTLDWPLAEDGSFVYRPNPGFVGVDSFSYRVTNNIWESSAAAVRIEVLDQPPVAVDDQFPMPVGGFVFANVRDNDSDPDDFRLTAELLTLPAHGLAILQPNGEMYYWPGAGFHGRDSFTYRVFDGALESGVATVSFGVNTPPVATNDSREMRLVTQRIDTLFGLRHEEYRIDGPSLLDNDSDPDGDPLGPLAWFDIGPGAHGQVTAVFPDGSMLYERSATGIVGLPPFPGQDSLAYFAHDGFEYSNPAVLTLSTRINHPPVANDDQYTIHHGSTLETPFAVLGVIGGFAHIPPLGGIGNVAGADTDADGDPLTAILAGDAAHGSLNLLPDGRFTYTPDPGFVGTDTFSYQVSDGFLGGESNVATVTIQVTNQAPTAAPVRVGLHGPQHVITASVLGVARDPDSDPLTAVLVAEPTHGTLVNFNDNGVFSYRVNPGFVGEDTLTYQAFDGASLSNLVAVTIVVTDQAPTTDPVWFRFHANEGLGHGPPGVLVVAHDPDSDPLTAVQVSDPTHGSLTFFIDSGSFGYSPDPGFVGEDTFLFQVFDGHLLSEVAVATMIVTNEAPAANDDFYRLISNFALSTVGFALPVAQDDSDADGDPLTVEIRRQPAFGSVGIASNGTDVVYRTFSSGTTGIDTFTYRVTDGIAYGREATVIVDLVDPLDSDFDGVRATIENGAPNQGDGNHDGRSDSTQVNVAYPGPASPFTVASPVGTALSQVKRVPNPSPANAPQGVAFPGGFLSFVVIGVEPAVSTPVTIYVSPGLPLHTYYKFGPEPQDPATTDDETVPHWYEFDYRGATGAQLFDDDGDGVTELEDSDDRTSRIVLHFVDGERGDDDLTINGLIFEPGGPASAPPPTVHSVQINDGSAQRSKVNSITITFDDLMTVDPGAFVLRRNDGKHVGLDVALSEADGRTVALLTFRGSNIVGGSLADGEYTLTIRADRIHDRFGRGLDGDSDRRAGGDYRDEFFRRFGDSDGDRDVDHVDWGSFLSTFGRRAADPSYLWYFDYEADGRVFLSDLVQFLLSQRRRGVT